MTLSEKDLTNLHKFAMSWKSLEPDPESGSGSVYSQKSLMDLDPDPYIKYTDPQHLRQVEGLIL